MISSKQRLELDCTVGSVSGNSEIAKQQASLLA